MSLMSTALKITAFFLITWLQSALSAYGASYYISTNGHDSNPGTKSAPFATLNRARDVIRQWNANGSLPDGGIIVYIRGGVYTQTDYSLYNESLLQLNSADDSGEIDKPIVWTAYPDESVQIIGGYQINSSAFVASAEYPNLLVADLTKLNAGLWSNVKFGNIGASAVLAQCVNSRAELFVNGQRMILARWPNIYYEPSTYPNLPIWNWTQIASVLDINASFTFEFSRERAHAWSKEVASASIENGPWLHGYWSWDWADSYTQIESIDVIRRQINTSLKTPPVYGYKASARYYGVNLLSELDTINEYYLDIEQRLVYISKHRQSTLSADEYYISVNPIPIQITGSAQSELDWGRQYLSALATPPGRSQAPMSQPVSEWIKPQKLSLVSDLQYVSIENISIGYATQIGLSATGVSNCNFRNIKVFGVGENGMEVTGYNNTLQYNQVTGVGCTGMSVGGGDLESLTRGNNLVQNNRVQYHSQWHRTYTPGMAFGGVGNVWSGNYVGYGPHSGFYGSCNDCLFDSNTFELLCVEASDCGAWYSGRSWVHRGNVISNNKFINIHHVQSVVLGSPGVQGVYLDDQLSGHNVTGNQFIDCDAGILLGGGRRVEVHNNKFAGCATSVKYDDRGLTWQAKSGFCQPNGSFNQGLDAVMYQEPPWSLHYPYLVSIYQEQPCTPVFDRITDNQYCCGNAVNCTFIDESRSNCSSWNSTCERNLEAWWSNQYC